MGERHDIEELLKKRRVIDVALDDEHAGALQKLLAGALEVGVVVVVEIVEPENAVTATLERDGDMGPDETGSTGHKDSEAAIRSFPGRAADPALPFPAAPGVRTEGSARRRGCAPRRTSQEEE